MHHRNIFFGIELTNVRVGNPEYARLNRSFGAAWRACFACWPRYARRMAVQLTWRQALAWRMQRQLLDPVGALSIAGVVGRLCGVQAQVASSAELAVRVRREASRPGEYGCCS